MCGLWLSYFFEKSLKDQNLVSLSEQQKEKLLKIAREGIEICLKTGKIKNMKEKDPKLLRTLCGAFVTLRLNKELRGCVGNIITSKPLYQTVQEMAVESATGDPRFRVLSLKELSQDEFARKADVPYTILTKIETGVIKKPSVFVMTKIAKALDVNIEDLIK